MLTNVSKRQADDEVLTLRSSFLDLGLGSVVSSEDEKKSCFGRIDEMLGSQGGTSLWEEYKKNPASMAKGVQAAGACIVLVANLERGQENTLDVVIFADRNGNIVVPSRTSVLSATYLAEISDKLFRGFKRQEAKAMSLTLVEFKDSETARKVSPKGSWTRAVPIQDEHQKLKEVGDIVIELARSFGSCAYCPLNQCSKAKNNVCKFETKWKDTVAQVVHIVRRERDLQKASLAMIRQGQLLTATNADTKEDQAEEKRDVEKDQIGEEQATDDDGLYADMVNNLILLHLPAKKSWTLKRRITN